MHDRLVNFSLFIKKENQTLYSIPNVTVTLVYLFISPYWCFILNDTHSKGRPKATGDRRLLKTCILQH